MCIEKLHQKYAMRSNDSNKWALPFSVVVIHWYVHGSDEIFDSIRSPCAHQTEVIIRDRYNNLWIHSQKQIKWRTLKCCVMQTCRESRKVIITYTHQSIKSWQVTVSRVKHIISVRLRVEWIPGFLWSSLIRSRRFCKIFLRVMNKIRMWIIEWPDKTFTYFS